MYNENWPRWISSSIAKHFDGYRQGVRLFVEGQDRDTEKETEFFELRTNGPFITEVSRGNYRCDVTVNTLVQATGESDIYKIQRYAGKILLAYITIPIYRYGEGAEDDETLLGCLKLVRNYPRDEQIKINYFGKIQPQTNLYQASVDADYYMDLDA